MTVNYEPTSERADHFLRRSAAIHGDRYCYDDVVYVNGNTKVLITCKVHGKFAQAPASHVRGNGCPQCAQLQRRRTLMTNHGCEHALQSPTIMAKRNATMLERHGVVHPLHSPELAAKAAATLDQNYGVATPLSNPEIRAKAAETMTSRYGAPTTLQSSVLRSRMLNTMVDRYGVENASGSVQLRAKAAATNLVRYGCEHAIASDHVRQKITQALQAKYGVSNSKHRGIERMISLVTDYDWLYEQYISCNKTARQIAEELGCLDSNIVCNYLRRAGIEIRAVVGFSMIAIQWLDFVSATHGVDIQHALNGGEFTIPGTRYRVDGYCKDTNTVYEFHGDAFHGNLNIYDPSDHAHPFNPDVTAQELYDNTASRDQAITDLGYNLVVMWESDWNQQRKTIT